MCGNTKSFTHTQCFDAGTASVATGGPLSGGSSARANPASTAHNTSVSTRAFAKTQDFIRCRIVLHPHGTPGYPLSSAESDIGKATSKAYLRTQASVLHHRVDGRRLAAPRLINGRQIL